MLGGGEGKYIYSLLNYHNNTISNKYSATHVKKYDVLYIIHCTHSTLTVTQTHFLFFQNPLKVKQRDLIN